MIGLSRSLISEVLMNQSDLYISIGEDIISMKFFFTISTGLGDSLRILYTSKPIFKDEDGVLGGIHNFFEVVCDFGEHGSSEVGLIKHLMGLGEKVRHDGTTYISPSLIDLILEDLKKYRVAKTRTWFPDEEIQ